MSWKEIEAMRSRNATLKREARQWRGDELRKAEVDRKNKRNDLERAHKLEVDQINNSYIEQCMRLDDELAQLVAYERTH